MAATRCSERAGLTAEGAGHSPVGSTLWTQPRPQRESSQHRSRRERLRPVLPSLTCCLSGKAGLLSFGCWPPPETPSDDERHPQLQAVAMAAVLFGLDSPLSGGAGKVSAILGGVRAVGRRRIRQLPGGRRAPPLPSATHVQMAFWGWKISL